MLKYFKQYQGHSKPSVLAAFIIGNHWCWKFKFCSSSFKWKLCKTLRHSLSLELYFSKCKTMSGMDGSPPWWTSFFRPRIIGRILLVLLTNFQAALERILVKKLTQAQNPFIWSQIGCLPVRSKPKQQCNLPYLLYISGSQRVKLAAPLLQTLGHSARWAFFPRPRKLSWPGKCRDFQKTNKIIAPTHFATSTGGHICLEFSH